jgi:hypothetical protein
MARVVESVVPQFSDSVVWEVLFTKQLVGAMRHAELSKALGRPAPVPSIIIDGVLVFDTIPGPEELEENIRARIRQKKIGM